MATIWYKIIAETDDGRTLERERVAKGVNYNISPTDLPVKDVLNELKKEGTIRGYNVEVMARSVEDVI